MYELLKTIHSYNRYVLLALLAFVLVRSLIGWLGNKPYDKLDNATSGALVGFTHLQLLVGIVLYAGLSPLTQQAFQDFGGAMKNSMLRYWAIEHFIMMLLAVVFIQLARTLSKKASDDTTRHKRTAIYLLIATLLILGSLVPKGLLLTSTVG
jgi:ABC-type maltose transport system permease subunit